MINEKALVDAGISPEAYLKLSDEEKRAVDEVLLEVSKGSTESYDQLYYSDYDDDKPIARSRKKRTSSGSKKNLAFVAAAVVLVALIVVLGFVYVKKVHGGDFSKFISCQCRHP